MTHSHRRCIINLLGIQRLVLCKLNRRTKVMDDFSGTSILLGCALAIAAATFGWSTNPDDFIAAVQTVHAWTTFWKGVSTAALMATFFIAIQFWRMYSREDRGIEKVLTPIITIGSMVGVGFGLSALWQPDLLNYAVMMLHAQPWAITWQIMFVILALALAFLALGGPAGYYRVQFFLPHYAFEDREVPPKQRIFQRLFQAYLKHERALFKLIVASLALVAMLFVADMAGAQIPAPAIYAALALTVMCLPLAICGWIADIVFGEKTDRIAAVRFW